MATCARKGCNEKFTPVRKGQKYHSQRCGQLARYDAGRANLPVRECDPCGVKFKPRRYDQVSCSPRCTRERENARRRGSLEDVLAAAERRDIERQNAQELRKILSSNHRMERYLELLRDSIASYEATPLVTPAPKRNLPKHEDILVTSDWHVGQRITLDETGGLYEQDISTARAQVAKIWSAVEHLHQIESSGRNITKLHLMFLGDLVEGDNMRPSQLRKIEEVVTVQTVQGFDLLAWLIRQTLQIFPQVEVDMVGGNHDRTTSKPGDGGLGEFSYVDTLAWLAGAFLERVLAEDIKSGRLKIRNWTTFFGFKEINGLRVVFEHGSSFKWSTGGYGGIPWYGVSNLGPKYQAMLGGADLVILGHGHRPALLPSGRGWILTNGALPATSTYVQAGAKVISRPMQWKLSTHRDLGVTNFVPIYADVPGTILPGMVWKDPTKYADLASNK